MLEPWDAPTPLQRAYCIKEVTYTQMSGARFDVAMSLQQEEGFARALFETGELVELAWERVDVRTAICRKQSDQVIPAR